jgi:hypothetical protein
MMEGWDGPGQIIKILPARPAVIALARRLGLVAPTFLHIRELAVWTLHRVRPAQAADGLIAFVVINQLLNANHDDSMPAMIL